MDFTIMENIILKKPWYLIEVEKEKVSVQYELEMEIGRRHPLWGKRPVVFGRCQSNDDIVVTLSDNFFAVVHLVWNGDINQVPDIYPYTMFFENIEKLQQKIDLDALDFES